ncbi:hypothetical protein BDV25DRAFT_159117 [Aspergillus avenaceus]|uniref:Uncharacterized protein n=1 Tax=Aspergillus avenaceus TaxID=36643 RepID=A0A5N6TNW8_ASPAV|nr:hypothetical protein BDV25DRAFT_159117 [Aspergillus avenaceus]
MADESAGPTYIPAFAQPLAPYIKSRQEVLRIRQTLTAYLRSLIIFADDDPGNPNGHAHSHLSLCVPQDAVVGVKQIPPEVTGLRRKYLEALQANVNARKEYLAVSEKQLSERSQGGVAGTEACPVNPNAELQAYLKLLRERRQHAKLQIFQHYLQELKGRDLVKPEDFDTTPDQGQQDILPPDLEQHSEEGSSKDGAEGLLHNLERAVVQAKARLDREKRLLEELKARREVQAIPDSETIAPAVKIMALQRIRDELVHWVEQELTSVANFEEEPVQELPAEEIEESARLLDEQIAQIKDQYAAYVDARKRLLDTASRACQPIGVNSAKPPNRPTEQKQVNDEAALPVEPLNVLSFADDVLLPLSKYQRALTLQKSYLAGMLAKEKSTTLRILNRLSDESHLLPEYPVVARQPRFKHAAAGISSRHATNPTESTKPDEIVSLAEAWAFASNAARTSEQRFVEEKVEEGMEIVPDAQKLLQEIYGTMNQDLEKTSRDEQTQAQDDDGTWKLDARSTRSRARSTNQRTLGPWAKLNGHIGVTD